MVEEGADSLRVKGGDLEAVDVVTLPYPGFPTDLQPQLMVLLSQAEGTSRCTENVFESRFSFVDELRRMGADIEIDGHHALIRGPSQLHGATLTGLDVRAGAAGTLAGLVATGTTIIRDVHHVDRGYAAWVPRLQALGADVQRVPAAELGPVRRTRRCVTASDAVAALLVLPVAAVAALSGAGAGRRRR